jgi:hypothetical protein
MASAKDPISDGVTTETGDAPEPGNDEAIVYVDGKATSVKTSVSAGQVEVVLSNGIRVAISGQSPAGTALTVGSDGVIEVSKADKVRVVASGMLADSRFGVVLFSEPVNIASGRVNADGQVDTVAPIPSSVSGGRHTLQLNGIDENNKLVSVSTPINVKSEGTSTIGRVVIAVIVLALLVAIALPASIRRRRRT